MPRIPVEILPDHLEEGLYFKAQRTLFESGISRYTPLGVLFLLLSDERTIEDCQRLIGKEVEPFRDAVLVELKRRYPQTQDFIASADTAALIVQVHEETGRIVNTATVGHVLLAMFTMPDAKQTDVNQFLRAQGISEQMIRDNIKKLDGLPAIVQRLTTDFLEETAQLNMPIYPSPKFDSTVNKILAALRKRGSHNAVVHGYPGVGRRSLVHQVARLVQDGKVESFKGYKVRRLNWNAMSMLSRPLQDISELIKQFPQNAILIVDGMTQHSLPLFAPLFDSKISVIGIVSTPEYKRINSELEGKVESFPVEEPEKEVTIKIIKGHLEYLVLHHKIFGKTLDEKSIDVLIKFGPAINGLALPGGAVNLLDQIASYDAIAGDKKLTMDDVVNYIHEEKNIPINALTRTERERLERFPEILSARVIGHDEEKAAITAALVRARVGLKDPNRPIGSFVFLGPTGVGKTEVAKALAEALFDNEEAITRFDMSEYQESHTVARLIGAPPGYVGYYEGGELTNRLVEKPFNVILFDEIDKANRAVDNVLLQLLDDGRLTDGQGRTVDARHTIIIMTSNQSSDRIMQSIQAGRKFDDIKKDAIESFKKSVRPEFYNRIDEVFVFAPLTMEQMSQVVDLQLNRMVVTRMKKDQAIDVTFTKEAKALILEWGYSPELGARELRRVIDRKVLTPLSYHIIRDELKRGATIVCDKGSANELVFQKK